MRHGVQCRRSSRGRAKQHKAAALNTRVSPWQKSGSDDEDKSMIQNDDGLGLSRVLLPKPIVPYELESSAAERSLRSLIHHYNIVIVSKSMCPGPKRQFYPIVVQDEALFHTLMYCSAAHLAVLHGQRFPPEALYHHNQALRLFSHRLAGRATGPNLARLIIATCLLVALETFEGTPEVCLIHWNGLSRLVEVAGGLDSLDVRDNARRYVLWADLAASAALYGRPRFNPKPLFPLAAYFGSHSHLSDIHARALESKLYSFTKAQKLSKRAATVHWGLRNLSQLEGIRQTEAFADTADVNSMQLSDRVEILERLVGPLWCPHISEVGLDGSHPSIFKIFGFGVLIYIYGCLRDLPFGMFVMQTHASKLLEQIEIAGKAGVDAMCYNFPEMMLWLLFLGGRAAAPENKPVFAKRAAEILAAGEADGISNIEDALQAFLCPKQRN